MSGFHRYAAAVLLATACNLTPAGDAPAFDRNQPVSHWTGSYTASIDGRPGVLRIAHQETLGSTMRYQLRLKDTERGEMYEGVGVVTVGANGSDHVMEVPEPLKQVNGDKHEAVERLLLHRWNTDIISGRTLWHGVPHGLIFWNRESAPPPGPALDAARAAEQWAGRYQGAIDGQEGRLMIERGRTTSDGLEFDITLKNSDRGETYTGVGRIDPTGREMAVHIMVLKRPLDPFGGRKEQNLEHLYLHNGGTHHISGSLVAEGHPYGVAFWRP